MTRTVEQFQLSVEESGEDRDRKPGEILMHRMVILEPSKHWWQAEERRRVFWTVFLMDRFCSISTGCNLSLTSADVKRRLPCEGALWKKEQEVCAPFLESRTRYHLVQSSPRSPPKNLRLMSHLRKMLLGGLLTVSKQPSR